MLDDQLAQEFLVGAVQIVDGVDQRVAWPHAKKERHLADELMQIDDQRGPLGDAGNFDRAVHGQRRRARAALRAEKRERDA